MEASLLIGMVSACTALVAWIVGPIVALNVAKRQFSATAITSNRHKWIETLRDELAELISLLATALIVKSKWKNRWEEGRGAMNSDHALEADTEADIRTIVELAQAILKREWQRVKLGT